MSSECHSDRGGKEVAVDVEGLQRPRGGKEVDMDHGELVDVEPELHEEDRIVNVAGERIFTEIELHQLGKKADVLHRCAVEASILRVDRPEPPALITRHLVHRLMHGEVSLV